MEAPRQRATGITATNSATCCNNFWREGIERNKNYESIITLGMRGDGDMPMTEGANIALLEKIVADQRKILADDMNPDLTAGAAGLGALQGSAGLLREGHARAGRRDAALVRRQLGQYPPPADAEERKRSGGAGIYYHFDYVGGPRIYKWLNTSPYPKIWEQMYLAYQYGADRIWIVNVGDLKPMEFPIEFFLTLAWDPQRWPKDNRRIHATVGGTRIRTRPCGRDCRTSFRNTPNSTARRKPNCSIRTPSARSTMTRRTGCWTSGSRSSIRRRRSTAASGKHARRVFRTRSVSRQRLPHW